MSRLKKATKKNLEIETLREENKKLKKDLKDMTNAYQSIKSKPLIPHVPHT
jgi:hypothetical protein